MTTLREAAVQRLEIDTVSKRYGEVVALHRMAFEVAAGETLSVIPVFAPTLMPIRLAIGGVPLWETALAVVLTLAMIPLLIAVAGRVYRNAVVRSGARVRLSDALRAP
jgi:ABC-type Na+ efflux pump permease subunit